MYQNVMFTVFIKRLVISPENPLFSMTFGQIVPLASVDLLRDDVSASLLQPLLHGTYMAIKNLYYSLRRNWKELFAKYNTTIVYTSCILTVILYTSLPVRTVFEEFPLLVLLESTLIRQYLVSGCF